MKKSLMLLLVLTLCSCNEELVERQDALAHEVKLSDDETIRRMISENLLTLSISFIKTPDANDGVTIRCVADLENNSDSELVFLYRRFHDFKNYTIVDVETNKSVETFANSYQALGCPEFCVLPAWGDSRFEIHYEAFTCFQGTIFDDGRIVYEPNGTFEIFHEEFPASRLRFRLSEQGIIKQILDMKEQDAPNHAQQGGAE